MYLDKYYDFLCCRKNTHLAYSPISSYGKCLEIINAPYVPKLLQKVSTTWTVVYSRFNFLVDTLKSSGDRYRAVGISFHLSTKQIPSLQWNNCLCILWPYPNFLLLCLCAFPIWVRQIPGCLSVCQIVKKKSLCYSQNHRLLLPKLIGHTITWRGLFPRWSQVAMLVFQLQWRCLRTNWTRGIALLYSTKNTNCVNCVANKLSWKTSKRQHVVDIIITVQTRRLHHSNEHSTSSFRFPLIVKFLNCNGMVLNHLTSNGIISKVLFQNVCLEQKSCYIFTTIFSVFMYNTNCT